MSKKTIKGSALEHEVIADLTRKGYYVSHSCDPQSPFDMIAVSPEGQIRIIDVKTKSLRQTGPHKGKIINRVLSQNQRNFQKQTGLKIELLII